VFGRRIVLPEIKGGSGPRRAGAERQAINAPMQGTAADLIKLAMIAVQQALDAEGRATRMVMQVHDELVFEVPEAEVDWLREAVPRLMAGVASFSVPWWPRWASGRAGKRRTESPAARPLTGRDVRFRAVRPEIERPRWRSRRCRSAASLGVFTRGAEQNQALAAGLPGGRPPWHGHCNELGEAAAADLRRPEHRRRIRQMETSSCNCSNPRCR
jgi:hypothetical protein